MAPRAAATQYYSRGLRARFLNDGIRAEQAKAEASAEFKYADINYEIDTQKYLVRSKARVRSGGLPSEVPAGWPTELKGPLAWSSGSFSDEREYVLTLTDADKTELLAALKSYKCLLPNSPLFPSLRNSELTKFALPSARPRCVKGH